MLQPMPDANKLKKKKILALTTTLTQTHHLSEPRFPQLQNGTIPVPASEAVKINELLTLQTTTKPPQDSVNVINHNQSPINRGRSMYMHNGKRNFLVKENLTL